MLPRALTQMEKECMLQALRRDLGRNILRGFFWIWRLPVLIMIVGLLEIVIRSVGSGIWDIADLVMRLVALPLVYLFFWMLPSFISRSIDKDYYCIKKGDAVLIEKTLSAVRMDRVRKGSGRGYAERYYAVFYEAGTSYEIVTSAYVYHNCKPGDPVYVLGYGQNTKHAETFVIPYNFSTVLDDMQIGSYSIWSS